MSIGAQTRGVRPDQGTFEQKLKLKFSFEDRTFLEEKEKKANQTNSKMKNKRETFSIKDFAIIKVLGEGAFAKVLLVR